MISRGSTPTLTLTIKSGQTTLDLSAYTKLEFYLSESSSDLKLDKCDNILTLDKSRMTFDSVTHKITITLTQEETLKFKTNALYYQLRGLNGSQILTTNIGAISLGQILKGDIL